VFQHEFTEIDLSHNRIAHLDAAIAQAVGLQKLKLNHNLLTRVDPEALNFLTFVDVEMEGNPLKSLDDTVDPSLLQQLQVQQLQAENAELKEKVATLELQN